MPSSTNVKVKELICSRLGCKLEQITDDASLTLDLGADSLDVTEVYLVLEEEFGIELPDDNQDITVGDLIYLVEKTIKEPVA